MDSAQREARPARSGHAPGIGVAVLVPCLDEELTVAQVVRGFAEALPGAAVYVYDNASVDRTAEVARAAGAIVRHVPTPGKGTVVRRMFAEVDAEVYLLVDGDATYDPSVAPELVRLVREDGFDLVNVGREPLAEEAFRSGHRFGNRLLTGALRRLIGSELSDVLSGYKALSRRFVRSFPAMSSGFEIETEIAVHAATLALPAIEVTAPYRERPLGSESKLHTIGDGIRIAAEILSLARQDRPLAFFSVIWGLLCAFARPRRPRRHPLLPHPHRAPPPDCAPRGRPCGPRVLVARLRPRPRHRQPGPAGGQAARLPGAAAAAPTPARSRLPAVEQRAALGTRAARRRQSKARPLAPLAPPQGPRRPTSGATRPSRMSVSDTMQRSAPRRSSTRPSTTQPPTITSARGRASPSIERRSSRSTPASFSVSRATVSRSSQERCVSAGS
jgi:hypothetical protein